MKHKELIQTQKDYPTAADFYQYAEFDAEGAAEIKTRLQQMIDEYEKMGFRNCQNLVELKHQLAKLNYDKYRHKYPNYLFFDDDVFNEICQKNKLVVSTVENYTGYIPDDCWIVVKNENIDKEDIRKDVCTVDIISSKTLMYISTKNVDMKMADSLQMEGTKEIIESWLLSYGQLDKYKIDKVLYGKKYAKYNSLYASDRENTDLSIRLRDQEENGALFIAAPFYKIDRSKKQKKVFEVFRISKQELPKDPIVFRKVKDGILVIAFWK